MNKRFLLQKLGEQKLQELRQRIDEVEMMLVVVKGQLKYIKSQMSKFSKTNDSNSEEDI